MNLPSITRAVYATGFLTLLLALPTLAGTPPDLTVSTTTLDLGSVVSGAGAHADGKVYFAGGRINSKVTNVVQQIDLLNNTLKTLASLPTPRVGLGLATQVSSPSGGSTANHLYAIGGFDGHGHALNTVEIYNFATNT